MSEASLFASKRRHSITESRIKNIIWYIGECYILLLQNNQKYSKQEIKDKSRIPFEDFLRFRLVEDYLVKYKHLLKDRTSQLDEINFTPETQKEYIDKEDRKYKTDKIDIFINRIGLNTTWGLPDEKIYFAIECKRIKDLGNSISQYISDIIKFTNREYRELRLPFEGQLGFIEYNSITHSDIKDNINTKLHKEKELVTDIPLTSYSLNENISSTYISKHKRNIGNKEQFAIFHLLLDYSNIIVN
ncbi:hypothetical protein [Dysgonomonas mossii]|uniref:hypothetical protein n=1 Tax=Dysgonomonas mossii TaxID=163665 RepID=UPI003991079E